VEREREIAPPTPPEVRAEDVLRPFTDTELGDLHAALADVVSYGEVVKEAELPEDEARRLTTLLAEKYLAPGLMNYYKTVLSVIKDSSARESRIGALFLDRVRGLRRAEAVMRVVDDFVQTYIGFRAHVPPLLAPLVTPFETVITAAKLPTPPSPPERFPPTTAGPFSTGHYYVDGEAGDTLLIKPEDGRVNGPLLFTRKNHSWEVRFRSAKRGAGGVVLWFLYEFIFCILFRWWIPVRVPKTVELPGDQAVKFTTSIDYRYVTAYAVQPFGSRIDTCEARKII